MQADAAPTEQKVARAKTEEIRNVLILVSNISSIKDGHPKMIILITPNPFKTLRKVKFY